MVPGFGQAHQLRLGQQLIGEGLNVTEGGRFPTKGPVAAGHRRD